MLVASAMCIAGMWLISWLYTLALDNFRQGRAQADLTAQERMVTALLARDLRSQMFLEEDSKKNRGKRLSDHRTDLVRSGGYTPPRGGFFLARSRPVGNATVPNPNNVFEANSDGFDSSRSTDHFLQFTVLLPGWSNFEQFSAEVPAASGVQWFGTAAEVCYYLRQNGQTANGLPLFDLYRQERLVARTPEATVAYATPAALPDAPEVMVVTGGQMRTLSDLTVPRGTTTTNGAPSVRLQPYLPLGTSGPTNRLGQDKLMSNLLSFEVKFTGPRANLGPGAWPSDPASTQWPRPMNPLAPGALANSDYPYDNLPYDGEFDTHSALVTNWQNDVASASLPNGRLKPIRITSIQVRIRAHDLRTKQTRQTTLIQDM
jgi:hypothetical protein